MTSVILCDELRRVSAALKEVSGPLRYLSLVENQESFRIRNYLAQKPGTQELDRAELCRKHTKGFRAKYVEFLGQLNARNHSLHWWAMSFTNKNPYTTSLCRDTFDFLLISELIRSDSQPLLVITDSTDLAAQVRTAATKDATKVLDFVSGSGGFKRLIKRYTPAGIVRAFGRSLVLRTLSLRHRPAANVSEDHVVISTLTHPYSFTTSGGFRDAYFGGLIDHVQASGNRAIVLAGVMERPLEQLRKLRSLDLGVRVVPLIACLPLRSLLACTLQALWLYVRPLRLRGSIEIDGSDLSCLVTRVVKEASHSGDLLSNLLVYYGANWLAHNVWVSRCLYPYENRAWEKMLLLGMRNASPKTRMVGYQHASITLSHTNFILQEEEAEIIPLPDVILTTGPVIDRRLESEGNYPPGMIETAGALRQTQPVENGLKKRPGRCTRILVPISTSLEEYVSTLVFLDKAFAVAAEYEVRIRPNPAIPLESALEIAPLTRENVFSFSNGSLAEDLQWADVVLYASSTVGLEAVSMGIPAIYLDLGLFVDTDPMFGWDEFKWNVESPSHLIESIQIIDGLSAGEFLARQRKGQEYAGSYLKPVTASTMQIFVDA